MLQHLRNLSIDSLIYGLGSVSVGLVSFLFLPIQARFLAPQDFGYLALLTTFQAVVEIVAGLGINSAIFRYFGTAEKTEKDAILFTSFFLQLLVLLAVGLVLFPLSSFFSKLILHEAKFYWMVALCTFTGLANAFIFFLLSVVRSERKPRLFAKIQVYRTFFSALLGVILLSWGQRNYDGPVIANSLVAVVSTGFALTWLSRRMTPSFSGVYARKILWFAVPVLFTNAFGFLISLSDRFFIDHFLTPFHVGIYSFGSKLASILSAGLVSPFTMAVMPYAFSISRQPNFGETYARILKYFGFIMGLASLLLFYFAKEVVLVVGKQSYLESWRVIGPLLFSTVLYGFYYVVSVGVDLAERTYLVTIAIFFAGVASLLSNYFLIPAFGVMGATFASCLSNFIMFIFTYYFSQRHHPIPYDSRRLVALFFAILTFGAVPFFMDSMHLSAAAAIGIKISGLALFVAISYVGVVFDAEDRRLVGIGYGKLMVGLGWKSQSA